MGCTQSRADEVDAGQRFQTPAHGMPPNMIYPYSGKTGLSYNERDTASWDQREATVTRPAPPQVQATRLPAEPLHTNTISVGIDFGTARTGYSFACGTDPVQLQMEWPGEVDSQAKTISALLYETATWTPLAWGMDAYRQYLNIPPRDQAKYCYLESFKLLLSDTAESSMANPLPPSCPHARETVIGHFLAFVYKHLQSKLRTAYGASMLAQYSINYCMTIPAGWSDSAKHLTRRAAAIAGIIPSADADSSSQLVLLYEPEAAALTTCRQPNVSVEVGEKFLILDAGGGTVDFTMHVVEQRNGAKVLSEATYRACLLQGSKVVDGHFQDWLAQEVGVELYRSWCISHVSDFLAVMADWERLKKAFTGSSSGVQSCSILRLPFSLMKKFNMGVSKRVQEDKLMIYDTDMRAIFDSTINPILQTVQEMVSRAGFRPHKLLLVGGFGSSLYLRQRLEQQFGHSMGEVLAPPFGYSAVVEGAVHYLQKPGTIVARISTLTYGVQVLLPWKPGMPESEREWHPQYNKWVTRKGFLPAVWRGQKLEVQHKFCHEVLPVQSGKQQTWAYIRLFSTTRDNPLIITDDMELVATIKVPIDLGLVKNARDYSIMLEFMLGSTELEVIAHDTIKNKAVNVKLDFTSNTAGTAASLEAQRMAIRV